MTYTLIKEKMKQALHEDDFESLKRLGHILQYMMMKESGMETSLLNYYMKMNDLNQEDVDYYI